MRTTAILVLCPFVAACTPTGLSWSRPGDDDLVIEPPGTEGCAQCVDTPPATYTGPSTFWLGQRGAAPDCPPESPLRGLEGYLLQPTPYLQFARECRITPTDACEQEGKVCAPVPGEDYHTCIHHVDEFPCPAEYPERSVFAESESGAVITLCCQASPVPT